MTVFIPFADIQKTFGASGELIIKLRREAPEEINLNEPIFISIDGLWVPFYFQSFDTRGNNRVQVIFDDFETQKLAEELVGKTLHLKAKKEAKAENNDTLFSLKGYKVIDKTLGELGQVVGVLPIPENPCLQIDYNGREVIIPCHENFVKKIDEKKQLLQVEIPQELLNL